MNKYITGNIAYVEFTEGNDITFGQDFGYHKPLPSRVKFYPTHESNGAIWFIGDRHGIQEKHGISGEYGNGAINIEVKELPIDLVYYCKNNFLEK